MFSVKIKEKLKNYIYIIEISRSWKCMVMAVCTDLSEFFCFCFMYSFSDFA